MAQYIDQKLTKTRKLSNVIDWPGGKGVFLAQGDFSNGMTLTLQFNYFKINNVEEWTTINDLGGGTVSFVDADSMANFEIGPCRIRVEATAITGTPKVKVRVTPSRSGWFGDQSFL